MERFRTLVLRVCLAVAVGFAASAVSMAATSDDAAPVPVEAKEAPAEETAPGGLAATVGQVQTMAYALQQEARGKRLAVLKRLEAGEVTAEGALDELDKLPAPSAQFVQGDHPLVWLTVSVEEESQEVYVALPLYVVTWLIAEGPKMIPAEYMTGLKEQGFDIEALNLGPLLVAIGSLSYVEQPTPLFHVKQGAQEIKVMLLPDSAAVKKSE